MALEADYLEALGLLGRVCEEYRRKTGSPAYLVGGAFHSADFDLIVAAEERFHESSCCSSADFVPRIGQGSSRPGIITLTTRSSAGNWSQAPCLTGAQIGCVLRSSRLMQRVLLSCRRSKTLLLTVWGSMRGASRRMYHA